LRATAIVFVIAGLALSGLPPFASFAGEHGIETATSDLGQSWTQWIFIFASGLTGAAVFRVAGRVFLGSGRKEDAETAGAKKISEEPETTGGRHRLPASMFIPAAALVVIALAAGLAPQFRHGALFGATGFTDTLAYRAHVLESVAVSVHPPAEAPVKLMAVLRGLIPSVAGLLLAWFALSPYWPREKPYTVPVERGLLAVRKLHSGHVGDYVAFLAFGAAVYGGVLLWLAR
jgi:multicomponent Na+:H+ antiporter subunit D